MSDRLVAADRFSDTGDTGDTGAVRAVRVISRRYFLLALVAG
jgi:hypothetical protein